MSTIDAASAITGTAAVILSAPLQRFPLQKHMCTILLFLLMLAHLSFPSLGGRGRQSRSVATPYSASLYCVGGERNHIDLLNFFIDGKTFANPLRQISI